MDLCQKGLDNFLCMMIGDTDGTYWWSLTLCARLPGEEMDKWTFREDTSFSTLDMARKWSLIQPLLSETTLEAGGHTDWLQPGRQAAVSGESAGTVIPNHGILYQ